MLKLCQLARQRCAVSHKTLRSMAVSVSHEVSTKTGKQYCTVKYNEISLHPCWLRERCTSPLSVHPDTLQSIVEHHHLDPELSFEKAALQGSELFIRFSDGHESRFHVPILAMELDDFKAHGVQVKDLAIPSPVLQHETAIPPSHAYNDLFMNTSTGPMRNSHKVFALAQDFFKFGHVKITGVPSRGGAVEEFGKLLTGFSGVRHTNWGSVFNVRASPDGDKKDLAYTGAAIGLHVDNPYRFPNPGVQLMHMLVNDTVGGESVAVDGWAVAEAMRRAHPEEFEALTATSVRWESNAGTGHSACVVFAPHIDLDPSSGEVTHIRYSSKSGGYAPPSLLADSVRASLFFAARRRLAVALNDPSRQVVFKLRAGELWLVNNLRVLHGRRAFSAEGGERHLQGCYLDIDGMQNALFSARHEIDRHTAAST